MTIDLLTSTTDKKDLLTTSVASRNNLLREFLGIPNLSNQLFPELRIVPVTVNQVLYEQGDNIDYVYFPLDCVVSALAIMEDGTTLETSMVGREGLVGISTVLGNGRSRQWIWVTVGGSAIQLEARFLDNIFLHNEQCLKLLLRCYRALVTQVSQRCVCNTRHTILERLCCWLLMIHDRVGGSNLRLTQEMIASRVGARRAGITVAAGMLQEIQAIEYRRGQLHIHNRDILERTVCECYTILGADFRRSPVSASTPSL
ncbi:MAG TPA: Crp/Fnr family transcriptional regulator [Pyrinomonadaceae bacterium]|nr:Crp/Fnr family transcriptional regulator [Pyrinomonadaceae bacterium]